MRPGVGAARRPGWPGNREERETGSAVREVGGQGTPSWAHGAPSIITAGFITMTPQLFINYKLKSVAHLPWRMLTYKALNTFIDDLFAFVIKMPVMYRIGCLRDGEVQWAGGRPPEPGAGRALGRGRCHSVSLRAQSWGARRAPSSHTAPLTPPPDVVFFIYLYQRWIYRVDPTRVNEFGMSGEAPTAAAPVAEVPTAAGALPPPPAPAPTTTAAAAREEASTPLPAKPTQGASSATEPQEAPPKPAEDKKRD